MTLGFSHLWRRRRAVWIGAAIVAAITLPALAAPPEPQAVSNKAVSDQTESNKTESDAARLRGAIDTRNRLRKELAELERRGSAQKATTAAELQELEQKKKALQQDIAKLRAARHASQKRTNDDEEGPSAPTPRADALATVVRGVRPSATAISGDVSHGVTFRRNERSQRAQGVSNALATTNPETQAKALSAWMAFLSDELRHAKSVELSSRPVELDGGARRVHGQVVRLGLASEVFLSEDGKQAGVLTSDGQWHAVTSTDAAEQIREAVDILRRRRVPHLVQLPIAPSPASQDDGEVRP